MSPLPEICKYPDDPAPSCLASPVAALEDPGQCPNPCTVKMERHFLRLARWKFPCGPFQFVPFTPHWLSAILPSLGAHCQSTIATAPRSPPHLSSPVVTTPTVWAAPVSVWLNHFKTKNCKVQTSCLNPHQGSLILSPCSLVCDNPEHGFLWHS